MTVRMRGFVLLVIQALLVLTTAAKYEWERHTRPMVWVRAEPYGLGADRMNTLSGEGRYGQVELDVDACGLPTTEAKEELEYDPERDIKKWSPKSHRVLEINVRTIERTGSLVAVDAGSLHAAEVQSLYWDMRLPCKRARLTQIVHVYLPPGVPTPYTVKLGDTLWVLVTVPKSGPPRPVQLATSDAAGFHPWASK